MLCYMGGYGMHGYGAGMALMMVFWIVVLAAVVFFIYKKYNNTSNEALELLKMKFVKGEIDEEEYINKKNILLKK